MRAFKVAAVEAVPVEAAAVADAGSAAAVGPRWVGCAEQVECWLVQERGGEVGGGAGGGVTGIDIGTVPATTRHRYCIQLGGAASLLAP